MRRLTDAGGFLSGEKNSTVAQKWLAASDLDCVIFFKDNTEVFGEKLCCLLKDRALVVEFSTMEELGLVLLSHRTQSRPILTQSLKPQPSLLLAMP